MTRKTDATELSDPNVPESEEDFLKGDVKHDEIGAYVEVDGKRYYQTSQDAPLKAEQLNNLICIPVKIVAGTFKDKTTGEASLICVCESGIRFYMTNKLKSIISDNFEDYKGREILIRYKGRQHNPRTGMSFHDFDVFRH